MHNFNESLIKRRQNCNLASVDELVNGRDPPPREEQQEERMLRYLILGGSVLILLASLLMGLYITYISCIYWKYRHIPSPKRKSFLLGHIPNLKQNTQPLHELYFHWYNEVGSIYVIFFVIHTFVVILNPDDIKLLFTDSHNGKSERITCYFKKLCGERFLGNGILTQTDGALWKVRRRAYDAAFHKSFLRTQVPKFNARIDIMIEKLNHLATITDGLIPMRGLIQELSVDIITSILFSTHSVGSLCYEGVNYDFSTSMLMSTMSTVLNGVQETLRKPIGFQFLHPFKSRKYRAAVRKLRELGRCLIMKRLRDCNNGTETPKDMLSFMVEFARSNGHLSVEDLVDDFAAFYAAGQETTATLLCFTLILIHQHPHILQRLMNEVMEVVGNIEEVTADHIDNLNFMEQVFMETLRLYPPLTGFLRESPKGGMVLSGYHIPEETVITVVASVVCRRSEYFICPNAFNPDRFGKSNGNANGYSKYVYFPFGIGQRTCIGKRFAMMEAKVILTKLLKNFSFRLPSDYKLVVESRITLQPQGNLPFHVQCRK